MLNLMRKLVRGDPKILPPSEMQRNGPNNSQYASCQTSMHHHTIVAKIKIIRIRPLRLSFLPSPSSLDWIEPPPRAPKQQRLPASQDDDDEASPAHPLFRRPQHTHYAHTAIMSWFGFGGAKKEETPESNYDFGAGPASGFEESVGGGGGGYEPSMGGGECVCVSGEGRWEDGRGGDHRGKTCAEAARVGGE